MDLRVKSEFHRLIKERKLTPRRVVEIGGLMGPNSLLRFPEIQHASERICVNLSGFKDLNGVKAVVCNANDMAIFADNYFDLVMSNAMLEHDKYFWKSIAEMKRILKPGGTMIIGVPGYSNNPATAHGIKTAVFKFHFTVDYYRFSDMCVRDLFFDNMQSVEVKSILSPPRIIGVGMKTN